VLKSFLKDAGEADRYENLTITFIPGRPAVLTIYNNNNNDGDTASNEKEVEKVDLFHYKDKEQLHALLQSKGFQRRRSNVIDGVGSSTSTSTSTATILANGAAGVVVTSREVIQLDPLVPHQENDEEARRGARLVDRELVKTSSATSWPSNPSSSIMRYVSWGALVSLLLLLYHARRRLWKRRQQI
jgi:Sep15/SelM redox domain